MPKPANVKTKPTSLVWRCAVATPLRRLFDYLPIEGQTPVPGMRLNVPFGRRTVCATFLETSASASVDHTKLRAALEVLDSEAMLSSAMLDLLRWTASYYAHPIGEVVTLGLSPCERRGEPAIQPGSPGLRLTIRGRRLPNGALSRAPKQAQLLAILQKNDAKSAEIRENGISSATERELIAKGLIERCTIEETASWHCKAPLLASPEQQTAIDAINSASGFAAMLLAGVTGSGKTEVYLQAIAYCLKAGKQALVLVPEIGLTPQMVERFKQRFDAPIVALHSGLSDRERDRGWALARSGRAAVVIGTRSAVFCPLASLGLIIVDEEHDAGYSQQDGLRYSARDVAVKRAQLECCPVVMGSATPSLESLANAQAKRYELLTMRDRAAGAQLPESEVIDVRGLALRAGLSPALESAMEQQLSKGQQVLLFLNRRGFAPTLQCDDCGWVSDCNHCDARMTVHRQPAALICHHCGARAHLPRHCPNCNSARLTTDGLGTEQVETALGRRFPGVPLIRVDSDSMRGRQAMEALRVELDKGEPCILIGTQMLTKGHHFPHVSLVGVIDADSLLFSADFRGEERLLQLLAQVGGRAGRGKQSGHVLIQTRHPDHAIIREALAAPYEDTAALLLAERHQRGLPPFTAMAALRCDARSAKDGLEYLLAVREKMSEIEGASNASGHVLGPLSAPMSRRAGLYRSHLVLLASHRGALTPLLDRAVAAAESLSAPSGLRWFVDRDPIEPI